MPELTTEAVFSILIDWLQDNVDCGSEIIFDSNEDNTNSAVLLPWIERALQEVRDLRHLQFLQQGQCRLATEPYSSLAYKRQPSPAGIS
jgi:hypothetical protein